MDIRTLTGKAIATLIAAVVASALVTSFGAPHVVQGIADVAVLAAFAFAGVAILIDRRRKP
jgi:hypothetical protein